MSYASLIALVAQTGGRTAPCQAGKDFFVCSKFFVAIEKKRVYEIVYGQWGHRGKEKMSTKGKSYAKLSGAQIIKIAKLLELHCRNEGDICVYEEGWSDEEIARIALPDFSGNGASSVARRRIELGYGKFQRGAPRKQEAVQMDDAIVALLASLEARIAALEAAVNSPPARVTWRAQNGASHTALQTTLVP